MLVAGASACAQSVFGTSRRNPVFRILFNTAALVLTVQAAGTAFGARSGTLVVQAKDLTAGGKVIAGDYAGSITLTLTPAT